MTADKSSAEYAYSYQNPPLDGESDSLVIKLRCPRISSIKWCLKLYSLVLGGLGLLLSFVWVCFHLYVLSQTTTSAEVAQVMSENEAMTKLNMA